MAVASMHGHVYSGTIPIHYSNIWLLNIMQLNLAFMCATQGRIQKVSKGGARARDFLNITAIIFIIIESLGVEVGYKGGTRFARKV